MPKTMKKPSGVWPNTKSQKEADKETLKMLKESYKATKWVENKSAQDMKFNIAALWRKEQQISKNIKKATDLLNIMTPECLDFAKTIKELNDSYWVWVGIRYSLITLDRGY